MTQTLENTLADTFREAVAGEATRPSTKSHVLTEIADLQPAACGDCGSMTCLAAYYADLLKFLEASRCDPSKKGFKTMLQALSSRRPDLLGPELSCANSKETVPYIALVNGVLESFIAYRAGNEGEKSKSAADGTPETSPLDGATQAASIVQDHLATQMSPLNVFPFDQGLDATRTYLEAVGLSRVEVLSVFRSEACIIGAFDGTLPEDAPARTALFEAAAQVWQRASTCESLGLQPMDLAAIARETIFPSPVLEMMSTLGQRGGEDLSGGITEAPSTWRNWGYASTKAMLDTDEHEATGLAFISAQLLPRSGLSFEEVLVLTKSLWFANRLVITNAQKSGVFTSQLSDMRLMTRDVTAATPGQQAVAPLTEDICHELQAFIRLRNRLGWSVQELDTALTCLMENQTLNGVADNLETSRTITMRLLRDLELVISLGKLVGMPVDAILPLWSTMSTHGDKSIYARLFLGPAADLKGHNVFRPDPNSGNYFDDLDTVGKHFSALQMALRRTSDELLCLLDAAGITSIESARLTMAVVTHIYRHSTMCRMLNVTPQEYLTIIAIPQQTNLFQDPETTMEFVRKWRQLLGAGWSTAEVIEALIPASRATTQPSSTGFTGATSAPASTAYTIPLGGETAQRMARLAEKLKLGPEEVTYMTTPGGILHIKLDCPSLSSLCSLQSYQTLRESAAQDETSFVSLLEWLSNPPADATLASLTSKLGTSTVWPQEQLTSVLGEKYKSMGPGEILALFRNFNELVSLQAIMDVLRSLRYSPGRPPTQTSLVLFKVATPSRPGQTRTDSSTASLLQLCLGKEQLAECTKSIRGRQRTALAQFLLQQPYVRAENIKDEDSLLEYLMTDGQTDPQLETTRMKQAIATVQLYVQRCLLGLEAGTGVLSRHITKDRWASLQRHSTWQARRRDLVVSGKQNGPDAA